MNLVNQVGKSCRMLPQMLPRTDSEGRASSYKLAKCLVKLAPRAGFEPATNRLTEVIRGKRMQRREMRCNPKAVVNKQ